MKFSALKRIMVLATLLVGMLAPTLTSAAAPVRSTSANSHASLQLLASLLAAQSGDDNPLSGTLGGKRADFEDTYGESADDTDASNFAIGDVYDASGYESIRVFWANSTALHIQLNARSGWNETKSLQLAAKFLPADVDLDTTGTTYNNGISDEDNILYTGTSDALAGKVSNRLYDKYEVGGKSGDLRVVLVAGSKANTYAAVDIAIGVGDELGIDSGPAPTAAPKPTKTPKATEEPQPTEESGTLTKSEYLADIRKEVDARDTEMTKLLAILDRVSSQTETDQDYTDLANIITTWMALPDYDAPAGVSEIDDTYKAMNKNLSEGALNFTTALTGGSEADTDLLSQAIGQFQDAQSLIAQLDDLLTAEGV